RLTVAALLIVTAGWTWAADQLIAGRKLSVSVRSGRARTSFSAKDATIVAPAPGPNDPTAVGATLKIVNPTSGESASVDLPSASWSASSSKVQYKFKNPAAPSGPSAERIALLRNGSIKARAESTLISLNETSQGSLGAVLTV